MNKIILDDEDVDMILDALFELQKIYAKEYMALTVKDINTLIDELKEQSGVE
jgi:hypothetical protein